MQKSPGLYKWKYCERDWPLEKSSDHYNSRDSKATTEEKKA